MELKLMTFNIRTDVASDGLNNWKYRYNKVAKLMEHSGASVIGTQEGRITMLRDLEKEISSYKWFGEGRVDPRSNEHCAIFYRHKDVTILNQGTFWLSMTPEVPGSVSWESSFPRICTWGEFQMNQQPDILFRIFNLHLDHMSHRAREEGVRIVLDKIQELNLSLYAPTIVMGDFNAEPNSNPIRYMKQAAVSESGLSLADAHAASKAQDESLRKTFHSFEGGRVGQPIDYIFVSQDISIKETEILTDEIDGGYPSDHYPVMTTIDFKVNGKDLNS